MSNLLPGGAMTVDAMTVEASHPSFDYPTYRAFALCSYGMTYRAIHVVDPHETSPIV